MENVERCYQSWLEEYKALEASAPLTTADAMRLGGRVFEEQMRQAVQAGAYSEEWIEQLNQFSIQLYRLLRFEKKTLPRQWRQRFLDLKDDAWQIHPHKVLQQPKPISITSPDTVADQLAQGATLCQLF